MPLLLKRAPRFPGRGYRQAVSIPAALLLADDAVLNVTVRNLSARGFMATCAVSLEEGDWVGVDLPGYGIARAQVRWADDGEIGGRFRRPIAVDRCIDARALPRGGALFARAAA